MNNGCGVEFGFAMDRYKITLASDNFKLPFIGPVFDALWGIFTKVSNKSLKTRLSKVIVLIQ